MDALYKILLKTKQTKLITFYLYNLYILCTEICKNATISIIIIMERNIKQLSSLFKLKTKHNTKPYKSFSMAFFFFFAKMLKFKRQHAMQFHGEREKKNAFYHLATRASFILRRQNAQ